MGQMGILKWAIAEEEDSADEWEGMSDNGEEFKEDSDFEIEEEADEPASEPEIVDEGEVSAIHPVVGRGVRSGATSNYTATKAKIVKTSRVELDMSDMKIWMMVSWTNSSIHNSTHPLWPQKIFSNTS